MKPSIKQRWTPLVEIPMAPQMADLIKSTAGKTRRVLHRSYRNATHSVWATWHNVDQLPQDPLSGWVTLSIKRNDRQAECDWRIFMRIKNEICGPNREAVQLFPSMERVVDSANQYFLFVAPKGFVIGVGFLDRLVLNQQQSIEAHEATGMAGSPKQRDFDEGCPLAELSGPDPRPGRKTDGTFPLPLFPEQALEVMRLGMGLYQQQPKEGGDSDSSSTDNA